MASSSFNIHQSAQKEQPYLSEVRPRHPYAFCQCESDGCSECMQEKEQIGKLLLELAALRKRRARSRNLTPFAPSSILPLPIYKD